MNRSEFAIVATNGVVATFILAGGWWLAFYLQRPDIFQRSGALLDAFGALGIVGQVYIEMLLEEKAREVEETIAEELTKEKQVAGLRAIKERLLRNVRKKEADEHRFHRLRLIGFFAIFLALGSFVHGFGDYFVPQSHAQKTISPTHSH